MLHFLFLLMTFIGVMGMLFTMPEESDVVSKKDVISVLNNHPLQGNSFIFNGIQVKDTKGNDVFYAREEVDKVIEDLNKLLSK